MNINKNDNIIDNINSYNTIYEKERLSNEEIDEINIILTKDYKKLGEMSSSATISNYLAKLDDILRKIPSIHYLDSSHKVENIDIKIKTICETFCSSYFYYQNKDPHNRLLITCCLIECLRLFAPDLPFHPQTNYIHIVFDLIIEQLELFAKEECQLNTNYPKDRYYYILEKLAKMKCCIILISFTENHEEDHVQELETLHDKMYNHVERLFYALFDCMKYEHPLKIESYVLSIMISCIEEYDALHIPTSLLEIILNNLSIVAIKEKSNKQNNHEDVSKLTKQLIELLNEQIQTALSEFLKNEMSRIFIALEMYHDKLLDDKQAELQLNSDNSEFVDKKNEKLINVERDCNRINVWIYELHKINNSLLLYVLPTLFDYLVHSNSAIRCKVVSILGRLFLSSHNNYYIDYRKNFIAFLDRLQDVDPLIRIQMVSISCILFMNNKKSSNGINDNDNDLITERLVGRLVDTNESVRQKAVNEICDLGVEYSTELDKINSNDNNHANILKLLRAVGERMKDKKVLIRKEAMTGLAQVYSAWREEISKDNEHILYNIDWITDYVLKCYAYKMHELRSRTVQLLDDILLPKKQKVDKPCTRTNKKAQIEYKALEELRAKLLSTMFHTWSQPAKEAFKRILIDKKRVRGLMLAFSSFRIDINNKIKNSEEVNSVKDQSKEINSDKWLKVLQVKKKQQNKAAEESIVKEDHHQIKLIHHGTKIHNTEQNASLSQTIKDVATFFSDNPNAYSVLQKLNSMKNLKIFRIIQRLIRNDESENHRDLRDELIKTVGTKSKFGILLREICRFMCLFTITEGGVNCLIKQNTEDKSIDFLIVVAEVFPELFISSIHIILSKISHENRNTTSYLHLLKNVFRTSNYKSNVTTQKLFESVRKKLNGFCFNKKYHCKKLGDVRLALTVLAKVSSSSWNNQNEPVDLLGQLDKQLVDCNDKFYNASLLLNLEILSRYFPSLFIADESNKFRNIDTIVAKIFKDYLNLDNGVLDNKNKMELYDGLDDVSLKQQALQTVTNLLLYRGHRSCHIRPFFDCLFGILNDTKNKKRNESLKTTCCSCILKLIRLNAFEKILSTSEWHLLCFSLLSYADKNGLHLRKLKKNLLEYSLAHSCATHKYIAYLIVLGATSSYTADNKDTAKNIEVLLRSSIFKMRKMHEIQGQSISEMKNETYSNPLYIPEYIIPYVIHLFLHRPDSINGNIKFANSKSIIYYMLDHLLSPTLDNISFLFQIIQEMTKFHVKTDIINVDDMDRTLMSLLNEIISYLKKKIKKQENLKIYPGKIYLPKGLFITKINTKIIKEDHKNDIQAFIEKNDQESSIKKRKRKSILETIITDSARKPKKEKVPTTPIRILPKRYTRSQNSLADIDSDEEEEPEDDDNSTIASYTTSGETEKNSPSSSFNSHRSSLDTDNHLKKLSYENKKSKIAFSSLEQ